MARAERRKRHTVASKERTRASSTRRRPRDAVDALGDELARLNGELDQAMRGPDAGRATRPLRRSERDWSPLPLLRPFLEWLDELRGPEHSDDFGVGRCFEDVGALLFPSLARSWRSVEKLGVGHVVAQRPAPSAARARRRSPRRGRA